MARHVRLPLHVIALLGLCVPVALACTGDDGGGEAYTATGGPGGRVDIEFSGEQAFLPGFAFDSGFTPDASPVAVRATVTSGGGVTVTARATSDGTTLEPVAGTGSLAVEGSLELEVSARIDTAGIAYEGVVDRFEYGLEPVSEAFDPFALEEAVLASSVLPATELAAVPIPSVPGATLVIDVTGGEIETAFAGKCATTRDGYGQFTGVVTTQGTVECAATVEIEIPVVGTETFGPFAFEVPIPAVESELDLGTRSLANGEAATAMGICDDAGTTSGDTGSDDVADDTGGGDAQGDDTAGTGGDGPDSTDTSSMDTGDDDTGSHSGDPNYPKPDAIGCPGDHAPVFTPGPTGRIDSTVCLPPCGPGGTCPPGATGTATETCGVELPPSGFGCTDDAQCYAHEICLLDGTCGPPSLFCVLRCDQGQTCPDEMTCLPSGDCLYPN